jgi:predicted alpha/beta-hydrolase family hydrolase
MVPRRACEDRAVTATVLEIDTPHGTARAHLHEAADPRAALLLGHGAGGSVTAPDLVAVTAAVRAAGVSVALVEQPYRVAGRRSAAPARQLDAAWTAVAAGLRAGALGGLPLVAGGRSSGARVACRTAADTGAIGVLCLAFPLIAPRRSSGSPPKSRQDELDGAGVPVLVVQGTRDAFGVPAPADGRQVIEVDGDHRLRADTGAVAAAARDWIAALVAGH